MELSIIQKIAVMFLPLVFAITVHEAAHGWVANKLGDGTARLAGRLTLNPIPHIDPIGTIVVPIAMMVLSGFVFGWAKPVPVDLRNLKEPRKDWALIAVAGPLSNLSMALIWAAVMLVATLLPASASIVAVPLLYMGQFGILINTVFFVLNLLPLPPLDGSRVLAWLLPTRWAVWVYKIEPYGIFILIGLLMLGLWDVLIGPVTHAIVSTLLQLILS